MKNNNWWTSIILFLAGALVSYVSLQFTLFDIKLELDVPSLILAIITLFVGLYIADTLQKRVNRDQNQYSYISNKVDLLWMEFNQLSEKIVYSDNLDIKEIKDINRELIHPLSFLKQIFTAFEFDDSYIDELVKMLDDLEEFLSNLPSTNNVVSIEGKKELLELKVLELNKCFSNILKTIQEK